MPPNACHASLHTSTTIAPRISTHSRFGTFEYLKMEDSPLYDPVLTEAANRSLAALSTLAKLEVLSLGDLLDARPACAIADHDHFELTDVGAEGLRAMTSLR